MPGAADTQPPEVTGRGSKRVWAKRLGWALAILLTPLVLGAMFLSSPIGKRFVADQIAAAAPASGLRFEVGRIEGDIYAKAVLRDVVLKDPKGKFLTIPEVELDWSPLAWLWSGVDIRDLTAKRGKLERLPELLPGDPDAPILPDFDIRIDNFALENFVLSSGLAGEEAQRINFAAKVDIRKGRALIDAKGAFGAEDRIELLLDAEPDGDRFDLALDYRASSDGPIARLTGLGAAYDARITGEGTWSDWLGHGVIRRESVEAEVTENTAPGKRIAAFRLINKAGLYSVLGMLTPDVAAGTTLGRTLAGGVALDVSGTLEDSIFDGQLAAISNVLDVRASGPVDLARNRANGLEVTAKVRKPDWLAPAVSLNGARMTALVDGPFRELEIDHRLVLDELMAGGSVTAQGLVQSATASFDGETLRIPLGIEAERVLTGNSTIDARLVGGKVDGLLTIAGYELAADNTLVAFPDLTGELTLRGDLANGAYALAGPVRARGLSIDGIASLTTDAKVLAKFGSGIPWSLRANLAGIAGGFDNASVANIAGDSVRFKGSLGLGSGLPIVLRDVSIESERLSAAFDSRIVGARTTLSGAGSHVQYGAFDFDASLADNGLRADLTLADPYPAAGLSDVKLGIAPSDGGLAIDVAGMSILGDFDGALGLRLPQSGPSQIAIERLRIFRSEVTGTLLLGEQAISGDLDVRGGGLNGTLALLPGADGTQGFDLDLTSRGTRFGGDVRVGLDYADVEASGSFDGISSRIEGTASGRGLEYGALKLHAFNAKADIIDGQGNLKASIAGRRADRFQLKLDGDFSPGKIALIAQGEYGGRPITMPRRAVLTALDDGGYALAPTQIGFARGFTLLEGQLGGENTQVDARFARMPLRLADLAGADLGLGGLLSGVATFSQSGVGPATGNARFKIDGFTRSGLVLSSRPVDVFAVADLSPRELALGARLTEGGEKLGRFDARISGLSRSGVNGATLSQRVMRGVLDANLVYDGAAEALWRLLAIEVFDLTGPLNVQAKATGSLESPRITGSLASDKLRLAKCGFGHGYQQCFCARKFCRLAA